MPRLVRWMLLFLSLIVRLMTKVRYPVPNYLSKIVCARVPRHLFLSASLMSTYLWFSLNLGMLILWIRLLFVRFLSVGISTTGRNFCTWWNFIFWMILPCPNIHLIRLLGDMSQTLRWGIFCLSIMTKPVEDTLVEKQQQPRFFSANFVGLLCLRMQGYYRRCWCQQSSHITRRDIMPLNPIIVVALFDEWSIDFIQE